MKVSSALDLAAAIRGRRKDLSLTQLDLATRAGVSRVWLAGVEAGKRSVNFGLVLRVLDALDLTMDVSAPRNLGDVFREPTVDLDSLLGEYRDK